MNEAALLDRLNRGEEPTVVAELERVLAARPADPLANKVLAMIHGAHGRDAQAFGHLQRAAYAAPKDVSIRFMLGNVASSLEKFTEAAAAYKECLRLAPSDTGSLLALIGSLHKVGNYQAARGCYDAHISRNPGDAHACAGYGNALMAATLVDDALTLVLNSVDSFPNPAPFLEFAAYAANMSDILSNPQIRALHARLGERYTNDHARLPERTFAGTKDPSRPLRVGFISGDFALHTCATFMHAPIAHFNRDGRNNIIPVCFSTQQHADGGDQNFRSIAEFHDVSALPHHVIGDRIAALCIDILVDCSGLTPGQRLRAFTPRAAPVQCTWLGYPNTTGLPTMDFRLADAITDPPHLHDHCTEKVVVIDGCFLCYTPDSHTPNPSPRADLGDPASPLIFGSFNRLTKAAPRTFALWASVLNALPHSKFLVKSRSMLPAAKAQIAQRFAAHGIDSARVEIVPFIDDIFEHAAAYNRMDIAIDTIPYNGTTTTCEAAWMGVPTLTIAGDSHRSRVGASLNIALGLQDCVASNPAHLVSIAAGFSADRPALAVLKAGLRERFTTSPLRNPALYSQRFESLLRSLWVQHCASRTP